jgi:hypothetical protein
MQSKIRHTNIGQYCNDFYEIIEEIRYKVFHNILLIPFLRPLRRHRTQKLIKTSIAYLWGRYLLETRSEQEAKNIYLFAQAWKGYKKFRPIFNKKELFAIHSAYLQDGIEGIAEYIFDKYSCEEGGKPNFWGIAFESGLKMRQELIWDGVKYGVPEEELLEQVLRTIPRWRKFAEIDPS